MAMKQSVRVHLSPALFEPEEVRGGIAVIIDVLRASTTIAWALQAGAAGVAACAEVDEARALGAGRDDVLLGGERGGLRIEGFDLGNSPAEYTAAAVRGRTIAFTTTNGTRALRRAEGAQRVVVGALVNLGAVVDVLVGAGLPVHLVCAGVSGAVCLEDVIGAGAIARRLVQRTGGELVDDSAVLAAAMWDGVAGDPAAILEAMNRSHGGRNLRGIGLERDIGIAARVDTVSVVPELERGRGRGLLVPAAIGFGGGLDAAKGAIA